MGDSRPNEVECIQNDQMRLRRLLSLFSCAALTASLLVGCGSEPGASDDSSTGSRDEARLSVEPWDQTDSVTRPSASARDLGHRLAELVDFHAADFSGSWYDPQTNEEVVGVTTDHGLELLEQQDLAREQGLRIARVRWSLDEGQDILLEWERESILRNRLVIWGADPQGDGFELDLRGEGLSDAERADLLRLPGQVRVRTGANIEFHP
jgi:hypothetical protein